MLAEIQPFLSLRQQVLEQLGYDLFCTSEFWEGFFSKILKYELAPPNSHYDIISPGGLRIEVKYAQASNGGNGYQTFQWRDLQGNSTVRCKDEVDYYILIGYRSECQISENSFTTLGFTHQQIANRKRIVRPVNPKYRGKFDQYVRTLHEILAEIKQLQPYKNGWRDK